MYNNSSESSSPEAPIVFERLPLPPSPSELAFQYFAVPIYFQNPKKVIPPQVLTLLRIIQQFFKILQLENIFGIVFELLFQRLLVQLL